MSYPCPLCGKEKSKETLFCDSCTKKIQNEYEVDLPQPAAKTSSSLESATSHSRERLDGKSRDYEEIRHQIDTNKGEGRDLSHAAEALAEPSVKKRDKKGRKVVLLLMVLLLFMLAFFAYNELIRKGNVERSRWEAAIKENSIDGYLNYIEKHPNGVHVTDAEAALMKVKSEEEGNWDVLSKSDRITELRDFLLNHPQSNYTPLIKRRLDSLTWMGALHTNTAIAYAEYLGMADRGDFNGDYRMEAESRRTMLTQTHPVQQSTLDTIRTVVNNFCIAVSSLDHSELGQLMVSYVERYFLRGPLSRERLLGELAVDAAQSDRPIATLVPDLEELQYGNGGGSIYLVNLPIEKNIIDGEGRNEQFPGYILHLKMNENFQIYSVHETKPHPDAP